MRPKTRSQAATNFAAGGLPLCLSGIGIHPRAQASTRYPRLHLNHRHAAPRTPPCSTQNFISASEIEPSETAVNQRLPGDDFFHEWPRHAVALQMADLDRMREAIRKHRSNRQLAYPMEEQRTHLGGQIENHMNTVIHAVLQDPGFQFQFDKELQQRRCAKAA